MTLEIIVFISTILFGIFWYWRESRDNRIYRWFNRMTHSRDLQMKADNRKGFVSEQPFLMRLVYISLFFLICAIAVNILTPINAFFIQYFVSAIVGTLIGTYVASAVLFASKNATMDNAEDILEKGREFFTGEQEEKAEEAPKENPTEAAPEKAEQKSARDRLKDKGMIK